MENLAYLQDYINGSAPQGLHVERAEEKSFLDKPLASKGPVSVKADHILPEREPEKAKEVSKPVHQHMKETLLPPIRKAGDAKERAQTILGAAVPDIRDVPIPTGGIGLLLFISLLIVFAISPANPSDKSSPSRLTLIWQSILGNYQINSGTGGAENSAGGNSTTTRGKQSSGGGSLTPGQQQGVLQGSFT